METIINGSKPREFKCVDTWFAALYENNSTALNVKYWKDLFDEETFNSFEFEEDETFVDFEHMLNLVEEYSNYSLFQIIPYHEVMYNKIKLIYVKK